MLSASKQVCALLLLTAAMAQSTCDLLRGQAAATRDLNRSQVVGQTNSSELVVFYGGDVINDLFVMGNATVALLPNASSPNSTIVIQGNLYLFDWATFYVADGAQVSIAQTAPSQISFYAFDNSQLGFAHATVDHGSSSDLLQTWFVCHNSQASATQTDYSQRTRGVVAAFVYNTAALKIDRLVGPLVEVTLSDSSSLTATNNAKLSSCNTYFTIDEALLAPITGWTLGSFATFSQQLRSITDRLNVSLAISGTQTTFGLWLRPGANVVLNNSVALLFPSWGATSTQNTPITGLQPCSAAQVIKGNICTSYEDKTVILGSGAARLSVHFLKSEVPFWNAYFEGGGAPTTHSLTNSLVGESNCRNQAICSYTSVTIDGAGGFCTVENSAQATFTSSAIVTHTFVRNQARAVFDRSTFNWNTLKSDLRLQLDSNAVVKIINTNFPTVDSASPSSPAYRLAVAPGSLFLRASILPLPLRTVLNPNCSAIMVPQVQMEVQPLSAPRNFTLQLLDETQAVLVTRTAASLPTFFTGWDGNQTLYQPLTSGNYIIEITTTSGNESAVARSIVDVSGCKGLGCPYDYIGTVFDDCVLPDFEKPSQRCSSDQCQRAADFLASAWKGMTASAKAACVTTYSLTVGAQPLPPGVNISFASAQLSAKDLCAASVSGAQSNSAVAASIVLLFVLFSS